MYKGLKDESFRVPLNPSSARFKIHRQKKSQLRLCLWRWLCMIFPSSHFSELQQKRHPQLLVMVMRDSCFEA